MDFEPFQGISRPSKGPETLKIGLRSKAKRDTVATKFKVSLQQLMETIGQTSTQYVRCIKPNQKKSPVEVGI